MLLIHPLFRTVERPFKFQLQHRSIWESYITCLDILELEIGRFLLSQYLETYKDINTFEQKLSPEETICLRLQIRRRSMIW